eukprot:symbB.v1.2.023188.t1/scaffold2104.1/size89385/4
MLLCVVRSVGARQQVQGQLEDLVGDQVEEKEVRELAQYLSSTVLKSIEDVFAGAKRIQDWFGQISKKYNLVQAPVSWVSPLGLSCSQPYHKPETVKITSKRQEVTIKTGHKNTIHKVKQTMGFPPNFVHSMDATHMMMVAERCQQQGIQFAAVHDSFWTHAGDVPMLNKSIREAFVELYEKPVLQDFYEDLCVHLGGQQVPPVPVLGAETWISQWYATARICFPDSLGSKWEALTLWCFEMAGWAMHRALELDFETECHNQRRQQLLAERASGGPHEQVRLEGF